MQMSSSTSLTDSITRIWVSDWTGQKRVMLNGNFLTDDTTVGEVAEKGREELRLPRGPHAVYLGDQRLNRTATLAEAGIAQDAELELSPEVKAAGC
jgi:hypothetical protein